MRVAVIIDSGLPHQVELCRLMANGIRAHGHHVEVQEPGPVHDVDAAVCWGWAIGRRVTGVPVLVLERGHVGDRRHWTAAGWNGLGGRGVRPPALDDGERWEKHHAALMQPWKPWNGGVALLIGQVWSDMAVADLPAGFRAWAQEAAVALQNDGWRVVYRPHPRQVYDDPGPKGAERSTGALHADLARVDLCVTYSSTTGVEAVLAGVRVVAVSPGSMVWDVAGHSLFDFLRPPREAWAHRLAWSQWERAELESGEAWAALLAIKP